MYTWLYKYMYENDEGGRNLSCKYTVLCYIMYILEYIYIVQIAKRRILVSPVFAFNMQIPDQVECLVVFAY